jgi:hypothetical protein
MAEISSFVKSAARGRGDADEAAVRCEPGA